MVKDRGPVARPSYLCGCLIFEFFGNAEADFKNTALKRLAKDLRREYNVSAIPVQDMIFDDPERGVLAIAIAATSAEKAKTISDEVLTYVDANTPGRLVSDDWTSDEFESR